MPATAAGKSDSGPERQAVDLERALHEAESRVAALTGELEVVRKRGDDVAALLTAALEAQQELAATNQALRSERDAAVAAGKNAAGQQAARVQQLEKEREGLAAANERLKQVKAS